MEMAKAEISEAPSSVDSDGWWSRLIHPVDSHQFFDRYWEREHLFVTRGDPSHYRSLFGVDDVDRCLRAAIACSQRLLTVIPPPGSGRSSRSYRVGDISLKELYRAFDSGDSLRLMEMERFWPPVAELAASLREAFDASVSVGFYFTPRASQAFGVHFDCQENFIVQVGGVKEWDIYEAEYLHPMDSSYVRGMNAPAPRLDEQTARLREKKRLEKGDLLYIPRGFYHKAVALDEASLHLTVSIVPFFWIDLMKRAIELVAIDNPELRRSLPPRFTTEAPDAAEMEKRFRGLVGTLSEEGSWSRALESLREDELAARSFPPDGHFQSLTELHRLELDSLIERRAGFSCQVSARDNAAVLRFNDESMRGPLGLVPTFEFLCSAGRFRPSEMPGRLSDESRLVLVRRLIVDGLLRLVGEH